MQWLQKVYTPLLKWHFWGGGEVGQQTNELNQFKTFFHHCDLNWDTSIGETKNVLACFFLEVQRESKPLCGCRSVHTLCNLLLLLFHVWALR